MDGHSWDPESLNLVCGIPSRIWEGMVVTSFKLASAGRSDKRKRIVNPIPVWSRTDRWLAMQWQRIGPFSQRGWDVAIDNGDALHKACHGKEYEWLNEGSRKAEIQKEQSISIRLSEILTNDLHKYFYPSFITKFRKLHNYFISAWLRFTRWP